MAHLIPLLEGGGSQALSAGTEDPRNGWLSHDWHYPCESQFLAKAPTPALSGESLGIIGIAHVVRLVRYGLKCAGHVLPPHLRSLPEPSLVSGTRRCVPGLRLASSRLNPVSNILSPESHRYGIAYCTRAAQFSAQTDTRHERAR